MRSSRYCHDVRPSVCLSGTGVHCDYTVHVSADLSSWLDSPVFWTPWHQSISTYSQPSFSSSTWKSANRKTHMPRRLAQQRMALSDLEWPFQYLFSPHKMKKLTKWWYYWKKLNANVNALCTTSTLKSTSSASRAISAVAELLVQLLCKSHNSRTYGLAGVKTIRCFAASRVRRVDATPRFIVSFVTGTLRQ